MNTKAEDSKTIISSYTKQVKTGRWRKRTNCKTLQVIQKKKDC